MKSLMDYMPPTITGFFGKVSIAEEEIAKAKLSFPDKTEAIDSAFLILRPTTFIDGLAEEVYRSHVRELLARVVNGVDTRPGTKAEVMAVLKNTSLMAPLGQISAGLYETLFKEVLGELPKDFGRETEEPWKGAFDEELGKSQRHLRQEWRTISAECRSGENGVAPGETNTEDNPGARDKRPKSVRPRPRSLTRSPETEEIRASRESGSTPDSANQMVLL